MRRFFFWVLSCIALFTQPVFAAPTGKRVALVISNADYKNGIPKLEATHRDGDAVTAALEAIGFDVKHARDVTRDVFTSEVLDFVRRFEAAGEDAVSFFYYAGHGAADKAFGGQNFMLPVGTGFSSADDLRAYGKSLEDVIKPLEAVPAKSKKSFIVLDACRNVPFANPDAGVTSGMITRERVIDMLFSYATEEGQEALDANFYSGALAELLPDPDVEAVAVFKKVKEKVYKITEGKQLPWYDDKLIGDLYLARGLATAVRPQPLLAPPPPPASLPPKVPPPVAANEPPPVLPVLAVPPTGAVLRPGQAIATRFSGTKGSDGAPDPEGPVIAVADVARLDAGVPSGVPPVKAADIGQVYGAAVDPGSEVATAAPRPPDLYLAATSAYGLSIVQGEQGGEPAKPLDRGAPGATWAPGQFGAGKGGGPGAIYKLDGATGAVSLFAEIALDGVKNAGAGLGQLAYDPRTRQLFVTDLETGMIHRVSMKGAELGFFDHGVEGRPREGLSRAGRDAKERGDTASASFRPDDPATWGFASEPRRVWGLAVQGDRLFYGASEGPSVWSVGIRIDGTFGADARREVEIPAAPAGSQIPSIGFDSQGNMYFTVLGGMTLIDGGTGTDRPPRATQTAIVRYRPQPDASTSAGPRWSEEPDDLTEAVLAQDRHPGSALALGPGLGTNGELDLASCGASLWMPALAGREGGSAGKPVLLGWPDAAMVGGAGPAHVVDLPQSATSGIVPPGGMALVAPCAAPQQVGGLMTTPGRPPDVLPPARITPPPAVVNQAAFPAPGGQPPSGGTAPSSRPDAGGPDASSTGTSDQQGQGSGGGPAGSPFLATPCLALEGARFQCVNRAWELDVNLADTAHKGLDSLKVSALTPDSSVEPGLQTRTSTADPFRIRFDKAASGTQVPVDVCLFDLEASRGGKRYRCCRAQLGVTLPAAPCGSPAIAGPRVHCTDQAVS